MMDRILLTVRGKILNHHYSDHDGRKSFYALTHSPLIHSGLKVS